MIHSKSSGPKYKNQQRREPVGIRSGAVEIARIRKDVRKIDPVVGNAQVSHCHVDEQDKRHQPRCKPKGEQGAADHLDQGDKQGGRSGCGQAQTGKKLGYALQVRKLAPAVLHELAAPVEPDQQQQGALCVDGQRLKPLLSIPSQIDDLPHTFLPALKEANRGRARKSSPVRPSWQTTRAPAVAGALPAFVNPETLLPALRTEATLAGLQQA